MRLVYPDPAQNLMLTKLIEKRLGGPFAPCQCVAFMDDERLVGIVVYYNYRWPSIDVAFYCDDPRWALNRDMVAEALSYPFRQLECRRITALIERKNKRSRKMVQRLGFKEEGMLRKAGEKGDLFVYGLLPEDYKLRKHRGQEVQSSAAAGT